MEPSVGAVRAESAASSASASSARCSSTYRRNASVTRQQARGSQARDELLMVTFDGAEGARVKSTAYLFACEEGGEDGLTGQRRATLGRDRAAAARSG